MRNDYRKALADLDFSPIEIDAIEFVLVRMGVVDTSCKHTRPQFVECYELDRDQSINAQRWEKFMQAMGFRIDAIQIAEHALFSDKSGQS